MRDLENKQLTDLDGAHGVTAHYLRAILLELQYQRAQFEKSRPNALRKIEKEPQS